MLDIVYGYQNLLDNLGSVIDESNYKKEHFYKELGLSRATFYNKLKKRSFSISEMLKLGNILFPEEAKAFEIKKALARSRKDSKKGRIRSHVDVMTDARKKILL